MHFIFTTSALLALAGSSLALQVTSPAERSTIDLSKDNKIEWASVSTDPSSFNIVLTNNNVNPPVSIPIAEDVKTSDGSYEISAVPDIVPGGNYRINFEGTSASNQGILAQSGQFTVSDAGSPDTSLASFSSSTPSTSGMTSTSMMTSTMSSDSESTSTPTSSSGEEDSASASASESSDSASRTGSSDSASSTESGQSAQATGGASSLNTFVGAGVLAMAAALMV